MAEGNPAGLDLIARIAKLEKAIFGNGTDGLVPRMKRAETMVLFVLVLVGGKALASMTGMPEAAGVGAAGVAGGIFRAVFALIGKAAQSMGGGGGTT